MDEKARRKRSYAAGYLLSLAGKPLPLNTKREPVAYLYNGVRLPKLPEWDREMYPWAVIVSFPTLGYRLSCFSSTARYYVDEASGLYSFGGTVENPVPCLVWNKRFTDTDWCNFEERTNHSVTVKSSSNPLLWASFDILDEDGIVYLAASNPTPVYE